MASQTMKRYKTLLLVLLTNIRWIPCLSACISVPGDTVGKRGSGAMFPVGATLRSAMAKRTVRCIFLCLTLTLSQESFALACLNNATSSWTGFTGDASHTATIATSVAVPNTLPKNTVLWRSDDISLDITCWADRLGPAEYVYIYLSPTDPGYSQLGPDLELGVRLNGTDYYCDNGMEIKDGRCRKKLNLYIGNCAPSLINPGDYGCPRDAQTMKMTVSFFISKKSAPSAGKEGKLTGVAGKYGAFQLDGAGGMNDHMATNFRQYVTGLDQLRYVACASTLSISPGTINFGKVAVDAAQPGKTITEVPFFVTARKSCDSVYGLGARLTPLKATVSADDNALVPTDNASVRIYLMWQNDRTSIPFNKEFVLVPSSRDRVVVNNFLAQLKWNSGKIVMGKFNAGAAVDIYYK
ncbi:fimbrial protein [Burkholderia sp. F1]|uniref:fimbrial protein n=1 Tax=Burkholderia sp. F1 TaxID=3366817 RepID=UPI003D73EE67